MRIRKSAGPLSVHAIAGSYVVLLGLDLDQGDSPGLLGFAIERFDPEEDERYWLRGMKVFEETSKGVPPGTPVSLLEHPLQSFLWGDYTAKPGRSYEYRVVALYGKPKNLEVRHEVTVAVRTEPVDEGGHAIHFNRGVGAGQAYVREFGEREPRENDRTDPAYDWLSRGLEEALIAFIRSADGPRCALRGSVYEFNYPHVLAELKAAVERGVDVRIIYDRRGKASTDPKKVWQSTEPAVEEAGLTDHMIPRTTNSSISHNKFLVLLRDDTPQEVWTGSTNITWGGLFGQSNVGHLLRDPATAATYLDYWTRLADDPAYAQIRPANTTASPTPATPPPAGTNCVFSPRTTLDLIDWYAEQAGRATRSFFMTAAFGVHDKIAEALQPESDVLRYLVLERPPGEDEIRFDTDHDVKTAIGSLLTDEILNRWTREQLTGLNGHVRFSHTKFMLVDPLGDDPLVITGSGNFSDPSVRENDENVLVIQGDTRAADIYLGEFMRIFNHYYFRFLQQRLGKAEEVVFLKTDDSWVARYYDPATPSHRQRLLFK
ncbi:phospholipase D-like domain-containing protein [Lentzea aerocolonigenes]|uniref:phospholipase D-like domain-containing protein n=1 Tax=Lentzea aerocolonigenes TaxID=68170 RepID=UPI0004C3F33A|nr:phospholipase D-like domain-containing protein [Lentzea aerocolonigenes]MCP2244023.1 Phosphatidylserine/phosphatidylglycerophosphate/cardiolipin synthase [Lentzea aerocolonigenes]